MQRSRIALLALVSTVAFVAPACSGPDGAGAPTRPADSGPRATGGPRAVDIVAADLSAHARAIFESADEPRCIATDVVSNVGVDRLLELGLRLDGSRPPELTVPPMTDAEGDVVQSAFNRCMDFSRRDTKTFMDEGLSESAARCASAHYRSSPLPREHLLLRNHDRVPHGDLHARIEALWDEARETCRTVAANNG